jgi:hypothetical protein
MNRIKTFFLLTHLWGGERIARLEALASGYEHAA